MLLRLPSRTTPADGFSLSYSYFKVRGLSGETGNSVPRTTQGKPAFERIALTPSTSLSPARSPPSTKYRPGSRVRASSVVLGDRDLGVPKLGSAGRLWAGSSTSLGLLGLTHKMKEEGMPCRWLWELDCPRGSAQLTPGRVAFLPSPHPCPQPTSLH